MHSIELPARSLETVTFISGVLFHNFVLRHGEWNLYGPTFVGSALSFYMACFVLLSGLHLSRSVLMSSAVAATTITWAGIFGIALSMSIYRLFFHRLRSFPGPTGAKLTSWWASSLHGPRWHFYEGMYGLHKQYGDYVRIGMDLIERLSNVHR